MTNDTPLREKIARAIDSPDIPGIFEPDDIIDAVLAEVQTEMEELSALRVDASRHTQQLQSYGSQIDALQKQVDELKANVKTWARELVNNPANYPHTKLEIADSLLRLFGLSQNP